MENRSAQCRSATLVEPVFTLPNACGSPKAETTACSGLVKVDAFLAGSFPGDESTSGTEFLRRAVELTKRRERENDVDSLLAYDNCSICLVNCRAPFCMLRKSRGKKVPPERNRSRAVTWSRDFDRKRR